MEAVTPPTKKQNTRSLKNLLIDSRFQFSYALYFVSFGLISATIVMSIVSFYQKKFFELMLNVSERDFSPSLFLGLITHLRDMSIALAVFTVLYSVIGVFISMFLSHRIVGPTVAIRRFILDLKSGKMDRQLRLRKGDEFRDLEKDLNELSLLLKEKTFQ